MMPMFERGNAHDSTDYCGDKERLTYVGDFSYYCDSSQNMAPYDGFGSSYNNETFFSKYGKTTMTTQYYGPLQDNPNTYSTLVYSIINGDLCGDQFFLGEIDFPELEFSMFPNPANMQVQFKFKVIPDDLKVIDMQGKIINSQNLISSELLLDVSDLPAGIYFVQVQKTGSVSTQKLVITK